ncbi:MAG: HNH endonuclease [Sandaracinaceae bacterium]|nr:HNH endonuclease [Sandaracinaceae bacterium]
MQEAREAMTVRAGAHVDDDDFLAALARAYLGSSAASADDRADDRAGATPYTIAITVCDRCKTATQRAGADEVVIDEATLERARCDATELGRVDAVPPPKATRTVPPRVRRAVMARHGGRCAVPGCRHSAFVELHHTDRRADGGDHDPERLVPLCFGHHKGTHWARSSSAAPTRRASPSTTPTAARTARRPRRPSDLACSPECSRPWSAWASSSATRRR